MKDNLFGKSLQQTEAVVSEAGLPGYAASQITDWLYKKHVREIDAMTNLSKISRERLKEKYHPGVWDPLKEQISADGTKKYLFPCADGRYIEAAFIPEGNRNTLCVSTQVGCKMGCLFCMTGKQGFQGNLSAGEILNQYRSLPERESITNIVYMGMGEPFNNTEAVLQSTEVFTAPWGYAMSPRRITVSTIGLIPGMVEFIEKSQCHLAVSMHTPFEEERKYLMPVEKTYPLKEVIGVLRKYDPGRQRRISFEYIMFDKLNDTNRHVNELARLLNGLRCRINLIRFHPIPETPFKSSSEETIENFLVKLNRKGFRTTVRASRGQDIAAACGLLSTREMVVKEEG